MSTLKERVAHALAPAEATLPLVGIAPIDDGALRDHMEAELARQPPPSFWWRVMKEGKSETLFWFAGFALPMSLMAVGMFVAGYGLTKFGYPNSFQPTTLDDFLTYGGTMFALIMAAAAMWIGRAATKGPAVWHYLKVEWDLRALPGFAQETIQRIRAVDPEVKFKLAVIGKDPVLFLVAMDQLGDMEWYRRSEKLIGLEVWGEKGRVDLPRRA